MYLYGAGGHAKVIMDILKENSTELTGIIDDNPHIQEWMEYHVLSYDPKRMKVSEKDAFFFCYAARLLSIFIFKTSLVFSIVSLREVILQK